MRLINFKIRLILFLLGLLSLSLKSDVNNPLDTRLNGYRQECKELIKPARYEGSRITYYQVSKKNQYKYVELYMILESEYLFAFSGKEASVPINVNFYDSDDQTRRTLVYSVKNIEKRNVVVKSTVLNEEYNKKKPSIKRLKNIYIEYEFGKGKSNYEGVVLVIGNI